MTTCEPLPDGGSASRDQPLTLFAADSLARRSAMQDSVRVKLIRGGSGRSWPTSSPACGPDGSSSRTCPVCDREDLPMFSATSVGSDTDPAPDTSRLARWAPHIHAVACSLWRTPKASDAAHSGRVTPAKPGQTTSLDMQVNALEPTPGQLNPTWVEALMGYPIGWTELDS